MTRSDQIAYAADALTAIGQGGLMLIVVYALARAGAWRFVRWLPLKPRNDTHRPR